MDEARAALMAVREFKTAESFYKWLGKNHDKADEVWIKIHKVGSGLKSITPAAAIDVVKTTFLIVISVSPDKRLRREYPCRRRSAAACDAHRADP